MPRLRVNDIAIYYESRGRGEPLVLLPGLSTDISLYAALIDDLARVATVLAADNRGAGRTDKPDRPCSIDMMADDTAGLLTALGLGRAHILGISMGGRIAVALALRHPELVRSLILVSTGVTRLPSSWTSRLVGVLLKLPIRTIGKRYPTPNYAASRQREAARTYDATARLHELRVPTLILHGKSDWIAPYRFTTAMHQGISGSTLLNFNGGHLLAFTREKAVVKAIAAFLESVHDVG